MRWPHIVLSDRLYLTAPITANVEAFFTLMHGSVWSFLFCPSCSLFCFFVPFNSWSHSYASWISNAYLWRGLMSAAWWTAWWDSPHPIPKQPSSLLQLFLSSTLIIPLSRQQGRYLLYHTDCWHWYNSLLKSHHCSPFNSPPPHLHPSWVQHTQ